jgi:hypothetical protein
LRYVASTLAGFVGEAVTVRYDPRDLSEIRLFHRDGFLCRAVSEEHAGEVVTSRTSRRPDVPIAGPCAPRSTNAWQG